ncbi:MAG: DUF4836 family protein [Bacteroidota bacterium]
MLKNRRLLIIGGILLLMIFGVVWCNRVSIFGSGAKYAAASLIPDDVGVVMVVDVPQIVSNIDFKEIQQTEQYQSGIADMTVSNPVFAEIFKDPIESGINYLKPAFFTNLIDSIRIEERFTTIVMSIKDRNVFEDVVTKATLQDIKQMNGFKMVNLDRLNSVGWNGKYVVFANAYLVVDMEEKLDAYFNNPKAKSIFTKASFSDALNEKGEMKFWVNMEAVGRNKEFATQLGLGELGRILFKGNFVIGGVNFSKGKMEGEAKFLFNLALKTGFRTFFRENFDSDFSKFIQEQDRGSTFVLALNLPSIYELAVSDPGTRKLIENSLAEQDIDINEILRIMSGDFAIVNYYRPDYGISSQLYMTKIYRPDVMQKYFSKVEQNGVMQKIGEGFYATKFINNQQFGEDSTAVDSTKLRNYHLMFKENYVIFSDDLSALEDIYYGGYSSRQQMKKDVVSIMDDKYIYGEVDFEKMNFAISEETKYYESLEFNLGSSNAKFEMIFKDKSLNTLQHMLMSSVMGN